MAIGPFARAGHLSVKALRLYERQHLLRPAWVDPDGGEHPCAGQSQTDQRMMVSPSETKGNRLRTVAKRQVSLSDGGKSFWDSAVSKPKRRYKGASLSRQISHSGGPAVCWQCPISCRAKPRCRHSLMTTSEASSRISPWCGLICAQPTICPAGSTATTKFGQCRPSGLSRSAQTMARIMGWSASAAGRSRI
jgi:hypothetical protein